MNKYLAIDIGASSGRHIIGWTEDGVLKTKEIYRFPNGVTEQDGHLIWDMNQLEKEVRAGIDLALAEAPELVSLSIDTWGVDYVRMKGDEPQFPCFAYRDSRTEKRIPELHNVIPFEALYAHTGCQFQPFNTIYQLYDDLKEGRLEGVTDILMIPEYLMYRLCGNKAREYTNASTTGLLCARTGEFDTELTERLGLPACLFPTLSHPGEVIGSYKGLKVVLCATHDTGSAVEGIPMEGNELYLSSGTWSLLGVKTEKPLTGEDDRFGNFTNEGGVGYNRYQKNIMGMWIVNRLREELCPDKDFQTIEREAQNNRFNFIIDANASTLLAPESMKAAFDALLPQKGKRPADYFRCAFRSLAHCYAATIEEIEKNTAKHFSKLYIVGGGAKNAFLNRMTEEMCHHKVVALPIEATALGNLKIQMEANHEQI